MVSLTTGFCSSLVFYPIESAYAMRMAILCSPLLVFAWLPFEDSKWKRNLKKEVSEVMSFGSSEVLLIWEKCDWNVAERRKLNTFLYF